MNGKKSGLDAAFIDGQKRRLTEIQQQLRDVRRGQEREQADTRADASGAAHEYEDDAQKLTSLELGGNLSAVDAVRLSNIRRALQKIDEGTYGLSDESGSPIPVERLEANPESLYTLDEQRSRDATR